MKLKVCRHISRLAVAISYFIDRNFRVAGAGSCVGLSRRMHPIVASRSQVTLLVLSLKYMLINKTQHGETHQRNVG